MNDKPITVEDVAGAERLMGVAYTAREREQMVGNLDGQIASALARRAVRLPNAAPPATRFDPRLPGFRAPGPQRPQVWTDAEPGPLPGSEADIAFAPVSRLAGWIARRAISSRELTEIHLARIERHAPRLECFAEVTVERARAEADAADAALRAGDLRGPLHGVPYALKDLFDARGTVTGWGAEPYRDRIADADAAVVRRLREAGAVLIGKTAVGALAYNDTWYGGKVRNPWNPAEGSSGSSAGSASATAAGLCAFAVGTETLGSITSPSQRCGTTGLRPTYGRVSRAGGMALCWSLDKVGPICRSAEDAAMVLAALNGADPDDPGSVEASFNFDARAGIEGMRLGWLPEAFGEGANEVDRAALETARGLGVELVEVALPDLPYGSLINILYAEAAASFEELTLDDLDDALTWQADGAWPNTFRKARFLSAVDHVQLDRLRRRVMEAMDAAFAGVDAMIGPFSTGPMLVATNFAGQPCLHLRSGFTRQATRSDASLADGSLTLGAETEAPERFEVPQGISLWTGLFDEGRLVNLGMAMEAALGVADRRPPAFAD